LHVSPASVHFEDEQDDEKTADEDHDDEDNENDEDGEDIAQDSTETCHTISDPWIDDHIQ
jgi:hypothetical protein